MIRSVEVELYSNAYLAGGDVIVFIFFINQIIFFPESQHDYYI